MSIITLTTDYGIKDHFVAAVKGKIITQMPLVQIMAPLRCWQPPMTKQKL